MVLEQSYYLKQGGTLRPFKLSSGAKSRNYSKPLQRVMTDFGAEVSFGKAADKIKEHYGIVVPVAGVRKTTLKHACIIKDEIRKEVIKSNKRESIRKMSQREGSAFIVSETDGSMVPIVETQKLSKDKRKHKEVMYREARLTLAYAQGQSTPILAATFSNTDVVGKHMRHCVYQAGGGSNSQIHAVGDGAFWIATQVDKQFKDQAKYLVDFYHVSEYLADASHECATNIEPKKWLQAQQQLLKYGDYATVINNLKDYAAENKDSATNKCYQYLQKRTHQLHYNNAIKNCLPIGSGEIESAHRYIIQHRVKITGAWWLIDNAESMINLSIHRVNNNWDDYWENAKTS